MSLSFQPMRRPYSKLAALRLVSLGSLILVAIANRGSGQSPAPPTGAPVSPGPVTSTAAAVRPSALTPVDYRYLTALGTRLNVPGHERMVLNGTLTYPSVTASQSVSVILTMQLPNSIRIDVAGSSSPLLYDGTTLTPGSFSQVDANALLQMLAEDTEEAYLIQRANGLGSRTISRTSNVIDNLEATREVTHCEASQALFPRLYGVTQKVAKTYCFDTTSHWLDYTFSVIQSGTTTVNRTTSFRDWNAVSGEYYPWKVVVRDNGIVKYAYTATAMSVLTAAADGKFSGN
jgi:hypothetical protein